MMNNNRKATVTDYRAVKLAGHFSAHAQVQELDLPWSNSKTSRIHVYVLKSYDTEVAEVVAGHVCYIRVRGLYSSTTRRHIRWFLEEFSPINYSDGAVKVAAAHPDSYITECDGNIRVMQDGGVLYSSTWDYKARKQAVKEAVQTMKEDGTWNNFCCADYIGREL